ncbi:helix-turn-helix domain-containing protein [Halomonas sp. GXIMD04776]|uniref:helix-turn-helix domain-containing protein n=1 Tax=Halomonas sp. GXIMD04776 TaxID=3415605 RepID=UPI003CC61379
MSVQAIAWALHQQIVKDPGARHVLIGLANHADEIGRYAFPSIELLSKYTGLKRRTVQEKIKLLKELGVIKKGNQRVAAAIIDRADRRPVVYDLRMDVGSNQGVVDSEKKASSEEQRDAKSAPRLSRGANTAPRHCHGAQITVERGARSAPEPSLTVTNSHTYVDEQSERHPKQYRMTYAWEPDNDVFRFACKRRGMPDHIYPSQAEVADFIGFYSETDRKFTEQGWHDRLARWVYENQTSRKGTEERSSRPWGKDGDESYYGKSSSRRVSAAEARERSRRYS